MAPIHRARVRWRGVRIVLYLLLLAGCSDGADVGADMAFPAGADMVFPAGADMVFPAGANICTVGDACHELTCPADQYCYVPWFEIPFCGAPPRDLGGPYCLDPKCSPTVPNGCQLFNGHVQCPCL
jgi:hypothetical protein